MDRAIYLREVSVLRLPHNGITDGENYQITLHSMVEGYTGFYKEDQSITFHSLPTRLSPLLHLVKALEAGELADYFTAWAGRESELADQIVFCCGRGVRSRINVL